MDVADKRRSGRASVAVSSIHLDFAERSSPACAFRGSQSQAIAEDEKLEEQTLNFETLNYQAAGHADTLFKGDGEYEAMILKKHDEQEFINYVEIFKVDDALQDFVPRFFGTIQGDFSHEADTKEEPFMLLENLLSDFQQPIVMDCKLGVRSFEEKEAKSKKGRNDLYERLLKIGPEHLSDEEKQAEAITKYKWMRTRDKMSSLHSLGFRVDGIVGPNGINVHADNFANISERSEVVRELRRYFEYLPFDQGSTHDPKRHLAELDLRAKLAAELASKLALQRDHCMRSAFVSTHEFIGASLLIVADASPPTVSVHLIDLAKTSRVPDGITIDHRREWEPGNHEDGILFGIDNCISCTEEVLASFQKDREAAKSSRCSCCQS